MDCPDACSLLISLEAGQPVKVEGNPAHPITQGFACAKTVRYPERFAHPQRPLFPLHRSGAKGSGKWLRATWEEALSEISGSLAQILARAGGQAVLPYYYAGTMGLFEQRHPLAFFRAIGALELDETICSEAGWAGFTQSYGHPVLGPDPEDVPKARLILLWGINSLATNSHLTPLLKKARAQGAYIVHIDPYQNKTSLFADQHIKLRPGSDAALAYGLAGELFKNGGVDWDYLNQNAQGVAEFRAVAQSWDLERVEAATGVASSVSAELAQRLASTRPTLIRLGYGMTRHPGGASALRAVSLLTALTGDWRYPGGGSMLSTSGVFPLNKTRLEGRHFLNSPHQGYFRPNPAARHVNMNQLAASLEASDPPIEALVVFNSNPAVTAPDSSRVRAGLARPDLLVVVLEHMLTETAQMADWVLPATTFLEHPDLYTSYGHHYLSWNDPLLPAAGECHPNTWVFRELARRLDLAEPTLYWDCQTAAREMLTSDHPYLAGISLEVLRERGFVRVKTPQPYLPYQNGAGTASGKIEFALPPPVLLTSTNDQYPLHLLTPPAQRFLNSTYGALPSLQQAEGNEPLLWLHPQDAGPRAIAAGDLVTISSAQGQIQRRVRISEAPLPGTAVLEGTWWGSSAPDGLPANVLSSQELTDLGGGSTFHGLAVEVSK